MVALWKTGEDKVAGPGEMKYEPVDELEFPWHNVSPFLLTVPFYIQ